MLSFTRTGRLRHSRTLLQVAVSVALAGAGAEVNAQQSEEDEESGQRQGQLTEVIVTAQKREENLQAVPVAITALGTEALDRLAVTSVSDLYGAVPNLWIVPQATSPGNPSATIRGVNSNVSLTVQDGGVAFYVDGVYIANNMGAALDVADIERVEVLRGPQGTLYGRNATGGAINFITRAPSGKFGIRQDLTTGNYNLFKSRTRIDLPEWNGISATLSFLRQESDGFVRNLTPGRTVDYSLLTAGAKGRVTTPELLGGTDIKAYHAAIRYERDRLQVDYKFDYTDSANIPRAIQVLGFVDTAGGQLAELIYGMQPPGTPALVSSTRLDAVSNPYVSAELLEVMTNVLTLSYEANDSLTIKNIAAYRDVNNFSTSDLAGGGALVDPFGGTGAPFTLFTGVYNRDMWQFTEELQLIGQTDRLEWVAGLYYLNVYHPEGGTHTSINYAFQLMPSDLNGGLFPVSASPPGFVENKAYAVFGQGTFHLNDRLDATLGVRQSWDERSAFHGSSGVGYNKKLDHFDWTAILTYRPSDTVTTYGKLATAYLSGGVSGASQVPYDPEEVFQAELGVKADLFGRRLRANVATFWSDYKDIQVLDFSTGEVRFVNAAAATVYGAEVELTAVPTDQLELGLSYGYTNFKYDEFILGGVDVTHTQRAWFRPEHTGNVSAEYRFGTFPWGGALSLRVDASYQSKIFFAPVQSNPEYDAASIGDPRWELNARATLADIPLGSAKGRLSLWGRNLANEDELEFAAAVGSTIIGTFMRPRTYGLDLTVEF